MLLEEFAYQQNKWRDQAHGIKNTGNCGENFASSVDFLRMLDRVEEIVVVNVPIHTKRALVHCFGKIRGGTIPKTPRAGYGPENVKQNNTVFFSTNLNTKITSADALDPL